MKYFYIIGVATYEKYWFINYLGKLLSLKGSVLIKTNMSYGNPLNSLDEPIEKSEQLDFVTAHNKSIHSEDYDYILEDIQEVFHKIEEKSTLLYMTSPRKDHLINNRALFEGINKKINVVDSDAKWERYFIAYHFMPDSKISLKYLEFWFQQFLEDENIKAYTLPFNEWDWMLSYEKDYENEINLKHLSKDYKKLLTQLLLDMQVIKKTEVKKLLRMAERS